MAAKARILAIDDQLYSRSFLEGLLAEVGYDVVTVDSVDRGLAELSDGAFELVIIDLLMPGHDGVSTVGQLRRTAPQTSILVLTGVGDVRSVVAAMREGASDYLLKPVDRDQLLGAIESAMGQGPARKDSESLIDENLAFMGRLALHERAVPLLGAADASQAAVGVLDLLYTEAGARGGALWLRELAGTTFALQATRGELETSGDTIAWKTNDERLDSRIRAGEIVAVGGDSESEASLYIPFGRDDGLMGIARLAGASAAPEALASAQRLSAIVLENAQRLARLASGSLLDARTGLHTRAFLEATLDTEVHKAHRFGRRLACLCVEPRGLPSTQPEIVDLIVASLRRTLRTTDVLCSDERRFWVLVTETDSLGGVVLKRRLAERIRDAVRAEGHEVGLALGVASYPLDGESCEELIATALDRVNEEKTSVMHELGLEDEDSLASIGQRLLERAQRLPRQIVPEAAELLVSELTCRPRDRGLFFMAPGPDAAGVLGPLSALGDAETATELFIATDGDTVPSGASVTAVAMPPDVPADQTWMVRFGEAPAYALVAGPLAEDGTRAVFHSSDPVLVEHMTFRLRAEVGLGVHS